MKLLLLVLWSGVIGLQAILAAPFPPTPVYLTEESAGPDYGVQGEYVGTTAGGAWSAQVIALGKGEFQAELFRGGLPGAGGSWSNRVTLTGKTVGDQTALTGPWSATIRNGVLTGKTAAGVAVVLRKTVRQSPTLGAPPPAGAVVLFDGKNADQWAGGAKPDARGFLGSAISKENFGNGTWHIEFLTPFRPEARGQGRGNSGVFFLRQYEVQVLDSFGLEGKANECGGIYKMAAPQVNMCFPPLVWQTYDIEFTAPQFDATGQKTTSAKLTVRHNGVLIHDQVAVDKPTNRKPLKLPTVTGPLELQGHGNPVFYRNIWFVPRK